MATALTNRHVLTKASVLSMNDTKEGGDLVKNQALVIDGERIMWIGSIDSIPQKYKEWEFHSLEDRVVTPGLIDCHTHLVFGGNRAKEFDMRLNGKTYQEIAAAGGGIASTVKDTRAASESYLIKSALTRLDEMINYGVTTVEIKSGYGLDIATECMMLRVARKLETLRPIRVKTSFLGSHGIDALYKEKPEDYIHEVCLPALRKAYDEGLVDAVDGFCEIVALSASQIKQVFKLAKELNIPVKLHAEQLSHSGGVQIAAAFNAISVDHLEYANEEDVKAMAASNSVAVVLPGAFYTLHEKQKPPIEYFRKYAVPMAIATDCNPGSSPMTSILLAMNMASTLFSITPQETITGVTKNAAKALGLNDIGILKEGMIADIAIWDIDHPSELSYRIGFNPLYKRIFRGNV